MSNKNPNMKLRLKGYDYSSRGYYFCTLVVRGRRPLFGSVVAVEDATLRAQHEGQNTATTHPATPPASPSSLPPASPSATPPASPSAIPPASPSATLPASPSATPSSAIPQPLLCSGSGAVRQALPPLPYGSSRPFRGACVAYSPFGLLVVQHIEAMAHRPELEGHLFIKGRIVMPDHIHLLIYIHDKIDRQLGSVLNGFHAGVRKLWRQMEADGMPTEQSAVPQPQPDGRLSIFESGFNDNVVLRQGQLQAYYDYMQHNPFRILQRQLHPDLFTRRWGRELLSGIRFDLYGNMFLLERPWRVAVRISRFATVDNGTRDVAGQTHYLYPRRMKTEAEVAASLQPYLHLARNGAVLITPCISPAEQALVQAAYAERLPVIMLVARGFSAAYHPSKAHYDACAAGLLLQISPWRYDPCRQLTKELCEMLNGFAAQLAERNGPL